MTYWDNDIINSTTINYIMGKFPFSYSCDAGYHGKSCTPNYLLPQRMNSDFSMMSQLDADWLTVGGGAIVGAHDGCGTILSGESLYFSKVCSKCEILAYIIANKN